MIDKLTPTKHRILAKRLAPEVMQNGIIIPEQHRDKNQVAQVVAVGKDVDEIIVGDQILTKKFYGEGISVAEDFFIIKEEDILGFIR